MHLPKVKFTTFRIGIFHKQGIVIIIKSCLVKNLNKKGEENTVPVNYVENHKIIIIIKEK